MNMSKFKNRRSLISRISAIFDNSKCEGIANRNHKSPRLELLESRLVPTFNYVVTNITDVPGEVGGPLDGSLRRGLQLAGLSNEDAVITFDPTVFNSQSPQTITLNGVDGALLLSNPKIQVNGPGTSSDFTPLTIQAINGIETVSVATPGIGYAPGDILYQPVGSGPTYAGGAQFTVTSVGLNGAITGIYVQKPGGGQQVNEILDSTLFPASLINAPVGGGVGTGAKLQVRTLRAASGLFVTQTQATSAELTGMTLANSFTEVSGSSVGAVFHIGGTLNLANIFIDGDIGNGIKGYGIYTQSGSGALNITDSKIINVSLQGIRNDNANSISINNSLIARNDTGGIYNYSSLNATIKITNSEFSFNGDSLSAGIGGLVGAIFTVSKLDIANSYFVNNVSGFNGGAIEMHGPSTIIKDSFFNSNITLATDLIFDVGFQTMGGGAIWNDTGDLTISKTGFTDNQANFYGRDSGGGAVYNQSGKLTLSQSTFYGNVANIYTNPAQAPVPPDATITDPSQYPTSRYSGGGALYSGGDTTINQVTFADNRVDSGVNIWRMPSTANWGATIPIQPMYSGGGAVYLTNSPLGGAAAVQSILTEVTFANNSVKATALPGSKDTVNFATPLDQAASPGTIDTDVYGRGLTGGALIISDAHERVNLNTNNDPYVGAKTNTVQMVNVTITNNKVDNQLLPIISANGFGLQNRIDSQTMARGISGGIFMDTAPSNTNGVQATNNLIVSNYGANFIAGKYTNNVVTDIGTQTDAFNIDLVLKESSSFFLSNGHNYYSGVGIQLSNVSNPSFPYVGQVKGPGPGDIRDIPQNLLDPNGLAYNPGPNTVVGMISPNIYTQNIKTDLIKTVGLTRNSPARDTGDISVFNSGLTTPFDNRYINRAVNLAIDIGAYEAQLPSLSTITSVLPNPAEYGQAVTIGVTVNSDGVNSKIGIVGTVFLENSKTLAIIASQPVIGLVPLPGQQATVSTTFNINNIAGQYFAASNIYDLRAYFDNSSEFAPSKTDIIQLTVNPAVTNVILNSGNPNPSVVNSTVAISGLITAPNSTASIDGAVTLYDVSDPVNPVSLSSSSVSSGSFSINYSFLESKVYYLQAKYSSSSGNFLQSVSNVQSQDVGQLLSNTLVVNPGTIGKGASSTLSATISSNYLTPITGPVQFSYTNSAGTVVVLGSVDSSSAVQGPTPNSLIYSLTINSATANLPLGTLPIVASYIRIGVDPYVGIISAPQNLVVNGQVTTTQFTILPVGTISYGSLVQFTATVNPTSIVLPFGASTVTFYDGTVALGTSPLNVTTRQAVFTSISLGGGTHNITAAYSGDGLNYQGSTSPSQSLNVVSRNTTTTLSCSPATGATGVPVIMTATIVGVGSTAQMASPVGSVVFKDGSVVLGTATVNSNNQAILSVSTLATGIHQLSATYTSSNANYVGSKGALVFIVKKVVAQPYYAIAPGQGPTLVGFNTSNNQQAFAVMPFGPIFKGGLRTATGDTNGDGVADIIVAAGPGGNSTIKIYDGKTLGVIATFQAYGGYNGAVNVAAGDLNNDGYADIITAPGSLGPTSNVKAFSGLNGQILRSFLAYAPGYTGGVTVAAGDVNGDGFTDIITGPQVANPPHVKVFSGQSGTTLQSFYAYSAAFNGGIFVAAGDFNGDGFADIVTGANAGGGPHVVVVSGANPKVKLGSFYAYTQSFSGGVRVGAVDINGDGVPEIITGAGVGIGPLVTRWTLPFGASNFKQVDQFFAYGKGGPNNYTAGTFPSV